MTSSLSSRDDRVQHDLSFGMDWLKEGAVVQVLKNDRSLPEDEVYIRDVAPWGVKYVTNPKRADECDRIRERHRIGRQQHVVGSKHNASLQVKKPRLERQEGCVHGKL